MREDLSSARLTSSLCAFKGARRDTVNSEDTAHQAPANGRGSVQGRGAKERGRAFLFPVEKKETGCLALRVLKAGTPECGL